MIDVVVSAAEAVLRAVVAAAQEGAVVLPAVALAPPAVALAPPAVALAPPLAVVLVLPVVVLVHPVAAAVAPAVHLPLVGRLRQSAPVPPHRCLPLTLFPPTYVII